jgi:hypothetical protein
VDLLLHFATSTAAEQGTRHRADDEDDEDDALATALREAPAGTFPHIAALGTELMSGAGPHQARGQDVTGQPGVTPGIASWWTWT